MMSTRLLPSVLIVLMVSTFWLMISSPVAAVKGSYPGTNGKIAFDASDPTEGDAEVYVMNADGTGLHDLSNNHPGADYSPTWSPDGTKIAFVRDVGCGEQDPCRRIFVMNADGTGQSQLTVESGSGIFHYRPAWSPDGAKVAFTKLFATQWGIYVIGLGAPGAGALLILHGDFPSWSPDGTEIAFSSGDTGDITVADANSGTVIGTVTSDGITPCWSPDGSKIVFLNSFGSIAVVNADGSGLASLNVLGGQPNWSPDGTKIVFSTGIESVWIMNADGSGAHDLTPSMPDASSPDWQRLAAAPIPEYPLGLPLLAIFMLVAYGLIRRRIMTSKNI